MKDYRVILQDMPGKIKSLVAEDPTGYGTILINSRLNRETQKECFEHERRHLENDDITAACGADLIEKEAHK